MSAQIKALGLVFNVVTDGAMSAEMGMILGTAIVLTYTTFGGMFSVAILDFLQMTIVMGGMLFIGNLVAGMTGGGGHQPRSAAGKLDFLKQWLAGVAAFIAAWMTMMLGSILSKTSFSE